MFLRLPRMYIVIYCTVLLVLVNSCNVEAQILVRTFVGQEDVVKSDQSYGALHFDKSISNNTLRVAGTDFLHGLGTHSKSVIELFVSSRTFSFDAKVGLDDSSLPDKGSATFLVVSGEDTLWQSGLMFTGDQVRSCHVEVHPNARLYLIVLDGGDGTAFDHANWLDAQLSVKFDSVQHSRGADTTWLSFDDLIQFQQDYDTLRIDQSSGKSTLSIAQVKYDRGFGTHSQSSIRVFLNPRALEFRSIVGADDFTLPQRGSVEFLVMVDGQIAWRSGVMRTGDAGRSCRVSVENKSSLELVVSSADDGNSYDHADWANPQLISWKASGIGFDTIPLTSVPLEDLHQNGYPQPGINTSVAGPKIRIGSFSFEKGLGTHASSSIPLVLNKHCRQFRAWVGPDMSGLNIGFGHGTVEFIVIGDGAVLWRSGIMRTGDNPVRCIVDLSTVNYCELIVSETDDGFFFDHATWAEAFFFFDPTFRPMRYKRAVEAEYILSPVVKSPKINGPRIFGVRPGSPLLFHIPVSGEQPMSIEVRDLPNGVEYDSVRHILKGQILVRGRYRLDIRAYNGHGSDSRDFTIVVGDSLSLTPPMGWNSWFVTNEFVTQDSIMNNMKGMISSGLADFGYSLVSLDAGWQRHRDKDSNITFSSDFPDPKGMVDTIHSYGFTAGLYTSPGWITCVRNPGSYTHEARDARSYNAWGFDLVKSDWCTGDVVYQKGEDPQVGMKRVLSLFASELRKQPRDIQFMVCQYGTSDVWQWAREIGGHAWRTASDRRDEWWIMSVVNGFPNGVLDKYAGPGGWNDYDFLMLGQTNGPAGRRAKTRLTPDEQYTHMSLWSIGKSPLIMSFSLTSLDTFTLSLLQNSEVLDINQDEGPSVGRRVMKIGYWQEVWVNQLHDGSHAVGIFNRDNSSSISITVPWEKIGIDPSRKVRVRDVWRQKDVGMYASQYTVTIPSHGCQLLRFYNDSLVDVQSEMQEKTSILSISSLSTATKEVRVRFQCTNRGSSQLRLYDLLGRVICESEDEEHTPGTFEMDLHLPTSLMRSTYFLQLRHGAFIDARPLIISE